MSATKPIRKNHSFQPAEEEPLDIHAVLRSRRTAWRVTELARLLSLGRRTLYDLVDSGRLPAIRIGAAVRISPADAMAFIEARTTGTERKAA
jgi:excisionase family DNA binding protein